MCSQHVLHWFLIALNPCSFYSFIEFHNSQDCHTRAWEKVADYIDANLKVFSSKMVDAEPVLMPAVRSWIRSQAVEHGNSHEDHSVIMIMNCPTAGILSGLHKSFITNFITNVLADFPLNGLCLLVHSNRASQNEGRTDQGLVTFCYLIDKSRRKLNLELWLVMLVMLVMITLCSKMSLKMPKVLLPNCHLQDHCSKEGGRWWRWWSCGWKSQKGWGLCWWLRGGWQWEGDAWYRCARCQVQDGDTRWLNSEHWCFLMFSSHTFGEENLRHLGCPKRLQKIMCHCTLQFKTGAQVWILEKTILRTQFALKERNLKIRNVTWIFSPVSQLKLWVNFLVWKKSSLNSHGFCLELAWLCVMCSCVLHRTRCMEKGMATSLVSLSCQRIPETCSVARVDSRREPSWMWTCCSGRRCTSRRLVIDILHSMVILVGIPLLIFQYFLPEIITRKIKMIFDI